MRRHTTWALVRAVLAVLTLALIAGCGGGSGEGKSGIRVAAAPSGPQAGDASLAGQRVIVGFRQAPGRATEGLLRAAQARVKYRYTLIPAAAATLTAAEIESLKKQPDVAYVEPDGTVKALEETTPWGIIKVHADDVWPIPNTGTGVKVAVIDTGIARTHPDLVGRYAGGTDFVNGDDDPTDDHGHGTHVAGIIAATDDDVGVVGAAPGASLYALKVLDASGSGTFSNIIAALQWCVTNGIQVANMSLGANSGGSSLQQACDNAYAAGVLLVAAAGNDGNVSGKTDSVDYPARYSSVIAVAATDSADRRASFSSTGPAVELAAPGVSILSDLWGGGTGTKSGTSMASPHVAGTAALVIASGVSSAGAVRDRLTSTATSLGKATWYGAGLVNALAAVSGGAPPPPGGTGSIAGTVTSAATGRGIKGAVVQVDGTALSATTNPKGKYTISNVPAGSQSVTASATGYSSADGTVSVASGSTTTWNAALSPSP